MIGELGMFELEQLASKNICIGIYWGFNPPTLQVVVGCVG
jgi:hypothetical protein